MTSKMAACTVGVFLLALGVTGVGATGMLYPRDSESREVKNLDGLWNFRADMSPTRNKGFDEKWFNKPLDVTGPVIPMPVPSSYNDVTQDRELRDFVGWAWYDREFFISDSWRSKRVVLRLDSAHYYAIVYVNSQEVMRHVGGHLPFEAEINKYANFGKNNRVTVAVNNTLTPTTLPPGSIKYETDRKRYPEGYFVQNLQMDFFNYAGIHRHVRIYTRPQGYIDDITVNTFISNGDGVVNYEIQSSDTAPDCKFNVELVDKKGNVVATNTSKFGTIDVKKPNLWYPYTMMPASPAYLYTLKVTLTNIGMIDVYRLPVGIRTVRVTETQLLINDKPFYCHGAAKHEDSDIRGKGLDYALIAKDFNMLKWLGVNCFRTSHYPYAEEILDQADRQGIMVIDESPGVGITKNDNFGNASLQHHLEVMGEMVRRDKNRPSVMIWSVANEPASDNPLAEPYFKSVIDHVKNLDFRPVTFVTDKDFGSDRVTQFADLICINRYYGWYSDSGHPEVIQLQLGSDFDGWQAKHKKPMIVTEYGADTIPGLHREPSFMFTEEYQVEFMGEYHKLFDSRIGKFLVGEMVWNFADFMTVQGDTRVVGNKKGVLTRQRQPKSAAFLLRKRYHSLMNSTHPN